MTAATGVSHGAGPPEDGNPAHRLRAVRRQLRYLLKYSAVSVGAVAAEQVLLFVCFGVLVWSTTTSNVVAFAVLTPPAYYLNRRWVWGEHGGRSRLVSQVLPFWALGLLGLGLSTWATAIVAARTRGIDDRHVQAIFVNLASMAAYGLVWMAKFVVLTTMVFNRPESQSPG